ncbi:MAG: radical SAM protein [Pseudomonadota bacterium]
MSDIVLVQPPITDFYLTAKRTLPYGLASIGAALKKSGFSVSLVDGLAVTRSRPLDLPPEMDFLKAFYGRKDLSPFALFHQFTQYGYTIGHIAALVRDAGPFLVGISSLFTPYAKDALDTAREIRRLVPGCTIVLGGHHPTHLPGSVMESPDVDLVLRGEGEASMPELARVLKAGSSLDSVPGIVFRRPGGALHISEPAWVSHLDALDLPAMDLVNQRFYTRGGKKSIVIVAGRGCPMGCSYCSLGASSAHARFRQRSVDSVLLELETACISGTVGFVDFEDENLTLNRSWFMSLLDGIINRFLAMGMELRAMNGLYPPSLDSGVVARMKQAGFRTLNLSLGSTSLEQLVRFRRPDVRRAFETAVRLAEENGMDAVAYLIAGAPGQDPLQSVDDLIYLAGQRVLAGMSVFYPAPGSLDFDLCRRRGLLPGDVSLMRSTALPVSDTTTRVQAATLLRLSRILNFMKSLVDQGIPIPDPVPCPPFIRAGAVNRTDLGLDLLAGLFQDGHVRGVSPDGEVFCHDVDSGLVLRFLRGTQSAPVRGVVRGSGSVRCSWQV